jgi:ABC-type Fe3+-hydroxamate transport system substrate-binding protein
VVTRSAVPPGLPAAEAEAALARLAERRAPAFSLDAAWLAALAPALVVTAELMGAAGGDPSASAVHAALSEARLLGPGAPTAVLVMRPRTLCDALEAVGHLAAAAGAEETGAALLAALRARLRAVARAVAPAPRPRPRVLSLEGLRPLTAGGHWLPEMKALAGGRDELQEPGCPAERLRWETVLSYDADVLLLIPCNPSAEATLGELAALAAQPGFWALRAVRAGAVYVLHHAPFSRPGPRLVEGVETLARVLHPDLVAGPLLPGAALKLVVPPGGRCRPHQLRNHFVPYE